MAFIESGESLDLPAIYKQIKFGHVDLQYLNSYWIRIESTSTTCVSHFE